MIHLITGGSGSGKSKYAEQQILELGDAHRIYIATMYPYDEESIKRVERHRLMRANEKFETIECYYSLAQQQIPLHSNVLLECMSNLLANEMFMKEGAGIHAVDAILDGIDSVAEAADNLIIVTNEIFSDGISHSRETHFYQEFLGAINQHIAKISDSVTEVVVGIPIPVKRPKKD